MLALKMVLGRTWGLISSELHICCLALQIKLILAVFLNLNKGYVHLTVYLSFIIPEDVLTIGVLIKQSKNVLLINSSRVSQEPK